MRFSRLAILVTLLLSACVKKASAYTFDWKGTISSAWSNPANWTRSGSGGTSTYPGETSSVDVVRIGVIAFATISPTVYSSGTVASIEFGDNNGTAMSLNINTAVTLTVTGSIKIDHNNANGGITTSLIGSGTGAIMCGSIIVGDNTAPPAPGGIVGFGGTAPTTNSTTLSISVPVLTVNGDMALNSTSSSLGTWDVFFQNYCVNNPIVKLNSGTLTVNNIITTNSAYVNRNDGFYSISNSCTYQMDLGATANTLVLLGATPLTAATGGVFDFASATGTASVSIVNYAATSGTQSVYNSSNSFMGTSPTVYPSLTLSGASAKTVASGALTIGDDLITSGGTVSLLVNNPSITTAGDWTNSTTVNEGSGAVAIGGNLTINSGGTVNGYTSAAATTISGTTNNSGSILENAENMTYTGALTNSFIYTCAGGTATFNGAFTNSGSAAIFTCGSGSVYFNNDFTNSSGSTFTPGTGTVYFNKAGAQTLTDNSVSGTTFNNVTVQNSGTKTMAGTGSFRVSSSGVLTMAGTATLAAAGLLTLNSDASGSATVAQIPAGTSITGNVNAQRYITGGSLSYRGYRLLSSPVYASTVSGNNVYNINYLKNSIYLTGTSATGGFDNTAAANPTLYLYRENMTPAYSTFLNSNFRGINNINSSPSYTLDVDGSGYNIPVGDGYLCFFRGNRASATFAAETSTSYVPQTVTLTATGTLNQGQITVHDWFTAASANLSYTAGSPATIRGYNLVGNPYASSIDWENFQTATTTTGIYGTNVGNSIYVLDPSSHNYGAYIKGGGGIGTNNASNIIVSGQGFFVVASATTAKLIFNESAKTNTQVVAPKLLMGTPADDIANTQYLRLQLAKDSVNTDDMLIRFRKGAVPAYNPNADAPYKRGFGKVSLASLSSDQVALAINELPLPTTCNEAIPLSVNTNTDGLYTLTMKDMVDMPQLYDIWLMDAFRKDSLDMRHNSTYSFNVIKADTNTYGSHRFSLVIRQNPAYAYRLLSFTAAKVSSPAAKQVKVSWTSENEQNYTNFTVERSIDSGKTYDVLGGVPAAGIGSYAFVDKSPADRNLYRLKSENINNAISYSPIVPIYYSGLSNNLVQNNINLYPNPTRSVINVNIGAATGPAPSYSVMITSSAGLLVRQVTSTQTNWQGNVSDLMPGTYMVKVFSNKDQAFIGSGKFVKM